MYREIAALGVTYVFRPCHKLSNHGLDDPDVSVQGSAKDTPNEGHPDVVCKAKDNHRDHRTKAPQQKNRFPANAITQSPPVHPHHGLRQSEGRDKQTGISGCIFFVADLEALDELPCVRENGCEGDRLGKTNDC